MEIVVKEFWDRLLVFFGCLGTCSSDLLGLELKTKRIFVKNRISRSGSGEADHGVF